MQSLSYKPPTYSQPSEENGSVVSVKSYVSALCPTDNPKRTNSQRLSTEEYASKEPEKASIEVGL